MTTTGTAAAAKIEFPGAVAGSYLALVQPCDSKPRPSWRVTSGESAPREVERLLRMLPAWFGIESSVTEYIEDAETLPTYLAWPTDRDDTQPTGVLLARRHFPCSAEIRLLAVNPARHRDGAGRALIAALEADLVANGVEFLQVKTLGPTLPDEGYAKTRRFYAGVGFRPLEEIDGLWPGNPCLIMIKSLRRAADAGQGGKPGLLLAG